MTTDDQVLDQLRRHGLQVEVLETTGVLQRVPVETDRRGKHSGWYVAHELLVEGGRRLIFGAYGNFKLDGETHHIECQTTKLGQAEREAYRQRQTTIRKTAEQEQQRRAQEAARRAVDIWANLPESGRSPYLDRKKVRAFGVRFSRGSIVVPMHGIDGELVGLQFIDPDGTKRFLTGTAKKGAYHLIGTIAEDRPLVVAEGYATAASAYMATGWPVVVAFDAGNLIPVAEALRRVNRNMEMLVAGDDDWRMEGNPGRAKALAAANTVGGVAVCPLFQDGSPS